MELTNYLKGRSILVSPNSLTQRLSFLMEKILTLLVPKNKSYVKDAWGFSKKLPKYLGTNFTLLTFDIVRLYTNIPHKLYLRAFVY